MIHANRVTIRDVANLAGVSVTTVSHALSGRRPVSSLTRQRIYSAVAELGFVPSEVARALRRQRTQTIALITDDSSRTASAKIARGAGRRAAASGFVLAIFDTGGDAVVAGEVVRTSLDRGFDGAILHLSEGSVFDSGPLRSAGVPVVFAGSFPRGEAPADHVFSDMVGGIRLAAHHVLASTTGRIGLISGPSASADADAALVAVLEEAAAAGRSSSDVLVTHTNDSVAAGQTALHALLVQGRGALQGVVCTSDLIAVGAVAEAKAWRLPIPARIAITGYGNTEAAVICNPGVTSVETFDEEIGQQSAGLLLSRICGEDRQPCEVTVPTQLIVRASAPTPMSE